jgi:hypothetical protein
VLGKLRKNLPPSTSDGRFLNVPILVELCFQTAGIWETGSTGVLALPQSIESLRLYEQEVNGVTIYAEVTPVNDIDGSLHFDARVVDEKGNLYLDLKNYRASPLPYSA